MDFNVDGDFNKIICFKEEGSDSNAVPKGSDFVSTRTAYQDNTFKCYISDSASNFTEATKKLKGKGVDLDNNRFLILQDMKNEAEVYMQEELSLLKWQEKATKLAHEDATLRMADLQENITSIEENLKTERDMDFNLDTGGNGHVISSVRGTTIISLIRGDTKYVVSDGRTTSSIKDLFLLVTENDKKIFKVSDNILATTAGSVDLNNEMLEIAQKAAQNSEDINKMKTRIQKFKDQWMKDKKNKRNKRVFGATIGLHSSASIVLVGHDNITEDRDGAIVTCGSGGVHAQCHFHKLWAQKIPQTPAETIMYLKDSVAVAGVTDAHTGGFIQAATLSPQGVNIEEEKRHIIRHLSENHKRFSDILKTKLLCISRELIYSAENERMVDTAVLRLQGVKKQLLLGVHERLIVRILEFVDEGTANRVFQNLAKGDHFLSVRLGRNVQKLELRRPTVTEFRSLAPNFEDETVL